MLFRSALFDEHDLSKGGNFSHTKLSNLDIEDFQRILRSFAFRTFIKGKNSYEKNELVSILSKVSNENPDIKFSINSFISDFTISVPLLIKDGIEYKWVHKSFQEYFTALYILDDAHDKKTRILKDILKSKNSSRYINVMDFFYDMDIKTFKSVVIKYIAEQYFEY